MLRKFKVSNFKCFEKNFEIDFTNVSGYEFNKECIKNNTINTAIVYGYNGSGKSNLALAIFDIIEHLTDKQKDPKAYNNYLCASSNEKVAHFYYEFLFDSKIVIYEYKKSNYKTLAYERLSIDSKDVVLFDREQNNTTATVSLAGTETLNKEITNAELSVLKYIKSNALLLDDDVNKAFSKLIHFVDSMLYFRSLEDRKYLGYRTTDTKTITDEIIEKNKVKDFEEFLNKAKIDCKLEVVEDVGRKRLAFKIGDKLLNFFDVISTGTSSLTLFYFWYLSIIDDNVPFLIIDEFDAFYHHELSGFVVELIKNSGVQCILTSHNVSNLTNDLLRPDCYFLMNKKGAKSLANCTNKELRKAHNIEKMYKAGAFNVE